MVIAAIFVLITIIGFIDAKCVRTNDYYQKLAVLKFFVAAMDVVSDCFFVAHVQNNQGMVFGDKNEFTSDNTLDFIYVLIFYASMFFIVLPAIISVLQLYLHSNKHWLQNDHTRSWLSKYSKLLLLLSLGAGSSFAAVALLSSDLFQLRIFNMGLTDREIRKFNTKRMWSIVLFEVCGHTIFPNEGLFVFQIGGVRTVKICFAKYV